MEQQETITYIPGAFALAATALDMSPDELRQALDTGQVLPEGMFPRFRRELQRELSIRPLDG